MKQKLLGGQLPCLIHIKQTLLVFISLTEFFFILRLWFFDINTESQDIIADLLICCIIYKLNPSVYQSCHICSGIKAHCGWACICTGSEVICSSLTSWSTSSYILTFRQYPQCFLQRNCRAPYVKAREIKIK